MRNRGPSVNPALVGVVVAGIMFSLLVFAFTNVALFASNIDMKAQVASGDTLAPNADVEVAGVKVGVVKSIDKGDPGALVDMSVDTKKVTMYKDASLQIRPHGVFGPKFVAINPGTRAAGQFPDGGSIPLANTRVSVDFEEVLNSLNANTRQSLQTVLYEFGTASENRGADFGIVLDKVSPVETQLTPVLQVVDYRAFNTGRLFESNAVITETLAASPIDQVIKENADVLARLDVASSSVTGVVDHGNNVLFSLDTITSGSNTQALSDTISKLPGLFDNLQRFNNDLGYGINALAPEVTPQHGQVDSDIGLAIKRTQDAFGQCDITDQTDPARGVADSQHANFIKIVPCYKADGTPFTDDAGHVAHHHVSVLLGIHSNPKTPLLNTVAPVTNALSGILQTAGGLLPTPALAQAGQLVNAMTLEEEGTVLCGPNSGNSTRPSNPAFSCRSDPVQSPAIRGYGTPPPPLFAGVFGAGTGSPNGAMTPATVAELPNSSRGRDILVAVFVAVGLLTVGFGYWRARRA